MMDYMFLPEAAREMCMPVSILKALCEQRRIKGAVRYGRIWMLPKSIDRFEVEKQLDRFCARHLLVSQSVKYKQLLKSV